MANYKIHFTDNYGCGTIECETYEEFQNTLKNAHADAYAEDIWCEQLDPEEGWVAL